MDLRARKVPVSFEKKAPGLLSRAASVCRDDFQPVITGGEPARLMARAMNRGRPEQA